MPESREMLKEGMVKVRYCGSEEAPTAAKR